MELRRLIRTVLIGLGSKIILYKLKFDVMLLTHFHWNEKRIAIISV